MQIGSFLPEIVGFLGYGKTKNFKFVRVSKQNEKYIIY